MSVFLNAFKSNSNLTTGPILGFILTALPSLTGRVNRGEPSPDRFIRKFASVRCKMSAVFFTLPVMAEVTRILEQLNRGEEAATEALLPLVYGELRKLAAHWLAHQPAGQTLQPTALVHEAYMRLVEDRGCHSWENRGHFFAAAAEAIRRILVENARRKGRRKRGGDWKRQDLDLAADVANPAIREDLLALDDALSRLAATDAQAAQIVNLRYFAGLSIPDAAMAMGISPRTADRIWAFARSWLLREMQEDQAGDSASQKSGNSD